MMDEPTPSAANIALDAAAKAFYAETVRQAFEVTPRKYETVSSIDRVINAVKPESDRATSIILYSFLDELIKSMFLAHLIGVTPSNSDRLFGEYGIMSSTAQRSRMLLHLGWIDEVSFHEISLFGKIRNRFAHRYHIDTFFHHEISGFISSIKTDARTPLFAALNVMKDDLAPKNDSDLPYRWLSQDEVAKVINEFEKRGKLYFVVCFSFLVHSVFHQITYWPVAQRFRVSPRSLLQKRA